MKETQHKEKLWTKEFTMLCIVNSLNAIASYMINPSFAQYLLTHGVEFTLTGIISSLLSWSAMLFRPFVGAACDRMNKKRIMIISYIGTAVSMMLYAVVQGPYLIFLVRILHGLFFGISGTVSMAFSATFLPVSRMAEGVGYVGLASLIGNMLGPQLGSMISDSFGLNTLLYICSSINILCTVMVFPISYKYEKTTGKAEQMSFSYIFAGDLLIYVLLIGLFSFGNGIISYYLKSMGAERNIANISVFFTVYAVVMLAVKPFAGKLQDRTNINFILYPAYILYAVGIIILANSYSLLPVLISAVFKSVGQGCGTPAIQAEAIKKMGKEKSGIASSTVMIGQDLGNAMGPIYAGLVIPSIGYTNVYYSYAAILVLGIIMLFVYNKTDKAKGEEYGIC